jgi:hypothetical protein
MLPAVAVVKVTVADTDVAALTVLERTMDGLTRAALNIAGNTSPEAVSIFEDAAVVMVAVPAAVAAAAFLSAATVHVTTVAAAMDAGVVTVSTRLVVDKAAVPADMPVQV